MAETQTWLVFLLKISADAAQAKISQNMGLPKPGGSTTKWADVTQRESDGRYVFPKPPQEFMTGVLLYVEETNDGTWIVINL